MINEILLSKIKKIIGEGELAFLSTINLSGIPETRAMLNLHNVSTFPNLQQFTENIFTVYFTSNTSSAKVKHIATVKKASVYYTNQKTFEGLLLTGEIEIVKNADIKKSFWQDNWKMYYKGGVNDPDYALLKFVADEYKYYNGEFKVITGKI